MKHTTLALIGAILFAIAAFAEAPKEALKCISTKAKLCPEVKAQIAIANTKLVQARLKEAEKKQQIQMQAQAAVENVVKERQASEAAYGATLTKLLEPLGFKGCTVTEEAEIGDCPEEPKGAAAKPAK
jgi:hypothetical protein